MNIVYRLLSEDDAKPLFSPKKISGLKFWLRAVTGLTTDGAAQFNSASSRYLNCADNAQLSTGDIDWSIAGWIYLDSKAASMQLAGKGNTAVANGFEYQLRYNQPTDRLQLLVSDGTNTATISANNYGSPATGAWVFVLAWHDSVNNTIGIQINNGTANTTADPANGGQDTSFEFSMGKAANFAGEYFDGRMDSFFFAKRVLTTNEKTFLYNSGAGRVYADLALNGFDTTNLISWWDLDEKTGTRADSHGSNNLTSNNSVGEASGIVSGGPTDTDPINRWSDQSGNGFDFVMATASRRPQYKTNIINGIPALLFDGVDDTLWCGTNIPTFSSKRGTLFVVAKADSAASGHALVSLYIDSGNAAPWELGLDSNGSRVFWYDGATTQYIGNVVANTWYYHALVRDADTSVKAYRNGSLQTTLTVANNQPDPGKIKVGSSSSYPSGSASEQFSGNVAEVIYYDRALTASELAKVHRYLSVKFAL